MSPEFRCSPHHPTQTLHSYTQTLFRSPHQRTVPTFRYCKHNTKHTVHPGYLRNYCSLSQLCLVDGMSSTAQVWSSNLPESYLVTQSMTMKDITPHRPSFWSGEKVEPNVWHPLNFTMSSRESNTIPLTKFLSTHSSHFLLYLPVFCGTMRKGWMKKMKRKLNHQWHC